MYRRTRRRLLLPAAALLAVATLATACGDKGSSESEPAKPKGWKELQGPTVSLAYPPSFTEQPKAERAEENDAYAYLKQGGRYIGAISIQSDFQKVSSVTEAAGVVSASAMTTTQVKEGTKELTVNGTEARRVDLTYQSSGQNQTAPKGSTINGVIVTGLDSKKKIFAVRIDAQKGKLSAADQKKIIDSISVK